MNGYANPFMVQLSCANEALASIILLVDHSKLLPHVFIGLHSIPFQRAIVVVGSPPKDLDRRRWKDSKLRKQNPPIHSSWIGSHNSDVVARNSSTFMFGTEDTGHGVHMNSVDTPIPRNDDPGRLFPYLSTLGNCN